MVLSLGLLNWSCSLFHPHEVEKDDQGYYINHYWSCGPKALSKAFKELDIHLSAKKISQEIQDSGNLSRSLLSLVHYDTVQITFPSEIYSTIEKNGFKVVELKELEKLNPEVDVALILVAKSYLKGQAHWLCFPVDTNIESYFGKGTKIIKIFLLKKVD
jgi:hypothetical protein